MLKRTLTLILTAVIIVAGLASCASESPAALTYGETVVTEAMYTYHVATYKARYIQSYSDIKDTDEFWNKDMGGKTGEEMIAELIYNNVAQNLVAAEEFRKAGLKLTAADTKEAETFIDSMVEELASGSRQTLNGQLAEFGINMDILREIILMEKSAYRYFEYLYGEDGPEAVDDGDREEYLAGNFVRFQQIYINNTECYETDKDGYYIQDENGEYKKRPFTEKEMADINARIKAVKDGLAAGEDFDKLKEKYSDSKDYEKGYYFSAATSTNYLTSVVSTAFALEEGEWTYVEGAKDQGAFFIKRLPVEKGAYKDEKLKDFFGTFDDDLATELYTEKLDKLCDDVVKNDDFINGISVKDSPTNYYYY